MKRKNPKTEKKGPAGSKNHVQGKEKT